MSYAEVTGRIWSCSGDALSDEQAQMREIVRFATLAPSGHNTQPWRFRISGRVVEILPDSSRRTPVVDPDDHHLFAALGLGDRRPDLLVRFGRGRAMPKSLRRPLEEVLM